MVSPKTLFVIVGVGLVVGMLMPTSRPETAKAISVPKADDSFKQELEVAKKERVATANQLEKIQQELKKLQTEKSVSQPVPVPPTKAEPKGFWFGAATSADAERKKIDCREAAQKAWNDGIREVAVLDRGAGYEMKNKWLSELKILEKSLKESRKGGDGKGAERLKLQRDQWIENMQLRYLELKTQIANKAVEVKARVERICPDVSWEDGPNGSVRPIFPEGRVSPWAPKKLR